MKNIYRITVNYLEPTSIHGMVIANDVDDAVLKFKAATGFDSAPSEYMAEIESVELIEENIPDDISSFEEYRTAKERTIN